MPDDTCSVDGCVKAGKLTRGWCPMHYQRWRADGDPGGPEPRPGRKGRQKATCHPDKFRKTTDGLCDTCYKRRRYQTDPEYRRKVLERNRRPTRPSRLRLCVTCERPYDTDQHNRLYCSISCRKRAQRARAKQRGPMTRRYFKAHAERIETGETGPVLTQEIPETGGRFAWCPCGQHMLTIADPTPSRYPEDIRRCRTGCGQIYAIDHTTAVLA